MSFVGRWLQNALTLSLSAAGALVLMQAPALTDAYTAALLQVASDARRDVEQRLVSARRFYDLPTADESGVVTVLATREPSNAETLALSIERAATLRGAYDRLAAAPSLLRPLVAVGDAAVDAKGYKRAIGETMLAGFVPGLPFSAAAAVYAFIGILLGSLVAQLLAALLGGCVRRILGRRRGALPWYIPPRSSVPS
jgi:hypothetical protein